MDAHGYVFTYPAHSVPFRGIEWVWGICIEAWALRCLSTVLVTRKVPLYEESNGTDTHSFFIYTCRNRGVRRRLTNQSIAAMKATERHNLIDRIKTLEGLTDDERSALLGLLRESKTYGLVWEDKPEEVEERLRTELPVLKEVTSRAIISDNPDAPNHILIEGDNLEALTTLAYTHEAKIDVIYIDPPYNTGNKDFVYNDSYVDSEDSYRHSKWLSFMSKRLKIAKKLLSDRGVIFISIDDNELHNLITMCDSLDFFGESNRVGVMCRATGTTTGQDANKLGSSFDYCVIYARPNFTLKGVGLTEKDLKRFKESDERGAFSTLQLRKTGNADRKEDRPNMFYPIIAPDSTEVYPFGPSNYLSRWRVSKRSYEQLQKDNMIVWKESPVDYVEVDGYIRSKWTPYVKYYSEGRTKQISNLLQDIEGNKKASIVIKEIFGDKGVFEYPKPVEFIKILETIGSDKDSIILDFFAGSGTTLHATMQLNAEDGGHRQCILCTNNENGICENVTYERNKRVIKGYTKPNGEAVEGLHDNNLRYYRTDFVGRSRSMKNMQRFVNLSTDMLCIKENLYNEQKEMAGMKTHPQVFRYFDDGKKQMLIIYREEYISQLVELIEKMDLKQKMKVYVFSPSDDPAIELFESVADKVKPTALPAAIYNTYKRILPKKPNRLIDSEEDALALTPEEEVLGGLFGENEIIDEVALGTKERGEE